MLRYLFVRISDVCLLECVLCHDVEVSSHLQTCVSSGLLFISYVFTIQICNFGTLTAVLWLYQFNKSQQRRGNAQNVKWNVQNVYSQWCCQIYCLSIFSILYQLVHYYVQYIPILRAYNTKKNTKHKYCITWITHSDRPTYGRSIWLYLWKKSVNNCFNNENLSELLC